MKKFILLLVVVVTTPNLCGCSCGIRQRLRDCFRRGAVCGTQSGAVITTPAPAPITYAQPAPRVIPQQIFQPRPAAPQVVMPQYAAPQYVAPQYAAPQCCPCQPCCPTVEPCCPTGCCPNGACFQDGSCCDPSAGFGYTTGNFLPGEYMVGTPSSDSGWQSDCCEPSYGGETVEAPREDEPTDAEAPGPE